MNEQFGELRSALERRAWSEVDAILADWTPERFDDALVYARAKKWKEPEVRRLLALKRQMFAVSKAAKAAGLAFAEFSKAMSKTSKMLREQEQAAAALLRLGQG